MASILNSSHASTSSILLNHRVLLNQLRLPTDRLVWAHSNMQKGGENVKVCRWAAYRTGGLAHAWEVNLMAIALLIRPWDPLCYFQFYFCASPLVGNTLFHFFSLVHIILLCMCGHILSGLRWLTLAMCPYCCYGSLSWLNSAHDSIRAACSHWVLYPIAHMLYENCCSQCVLLNSSHAPIYTYAHCIRILHNNNINYTSYSIAHVSISTCTCY
jgi:hypothetical protein